MYHTVVIKEWHDVAQDLLCQTILSWRHIIGMRGKHVNVSNVSKAKEWTAMLQITWRHAQHVVSPRVLYKFVNLISTLVFYLKFVFIEMLDKLITYIVCWYKILYQVLPVVWTSRITTRSDTGSHNRHNLIQSLVPPHYVHVCNRYIYDCFLCKIKGNGILQSVYTLFWHVSKLIKITSLAPPF